MGVVHRIANLSTDPGGARVMTQCGQHGTRPGAFPPGNAPVMYARRNGGFFEATSQSDDITCGTCLRTRDRKPKTITILEPLCICGHRENRHNDRGCTATRGRLVGQCGCGRFRQRRDTAS